MRGRPLAPLLFGLVAFLTGRSAVGATEQALGSATLHHVLVAIDDVLRTGVALAFCAFTIGRSEPHRRAREPLAMLASATAIAAILTLAPPGKGAADATVVAGGAVAVLGCAWLLFAVLALGRCFGVLPEARGLVTDGPYRLVRHPVYLGELTACLGLALAAPGARNTVVLAVFALAQFTRMRLEERALTEAFPQYAAYAAVTPRLIPRFGPPRVVGARATRRGWRAGLWTGIGRVAGLLHLPVRLRALSLGPVAERPRRL